MNWIAEARDLPPDSKSGAAITRLTSSPCIDTNIYCEQPQCSADGHRVAMIRCQDHYGQGPWDLLVADLRTLKLAILERSIQPHGLCTAAWSGWSYFVTAGGALMRVSLDTLEREVVLSEIALPHGARIASVSPDHRYLGAHAVLPGPTMGIILLDLQDGSWDVIYEHPEIVNPHLQFNPVDGQRLMVQHNRGSKMAPDGSVTQFVSEQGTTLFVLDIASHQRLDLPVGPPVTAAATGHECFVADTGLSAFTTAWVHEGWQLDKRFPRGNFFVARPGDSKPECFEAPEHRFNHVCISRCGRYFLCDSYPDPYLESIPLVIGNLQTGKYRTLLQDCGAEGGGAQYTHPHAYLTTDNRHIIYNANPSGIPQVCKATVPDDFLRSLD